MKTLVVGGGVAGLLAARSATLRGREVILLESSGQLGGQIKPVSLLGHSFDVGAEAFSTVRSNTSDLIQSLGLGDFVANPNAVGAKLRFVDDAGQPRNTPLPVGLLGIPLQLDDPALENIITAQGIAEATLLDSAPWPSEPPASFSSLVESRLGNKILERIVKPIVAGVHSSDPEDLAADALVPGLLAKAEELGSLVQAARAIRGNSTKPGTPVATLTGGMVQLVDGLESELRSHSVDVRLNASAEKVERVGSQWSVQVAGAALGTYEIQCDDLVLAISPHASKSIFVNQPELAEELARVDLVSVAVVVLLVKAPNLNDYPLGTGLLISPRDSSVVAKATTHVNAKWAHIARHLDKDQHVLRLSYGTNLQKISSENLVETALADAKVLYGSEDIALQASSIQLWNDTMISPTAKHWETIRTIQALALKQPGLHFVGAAFTGNGITGIVQKTSNLFQEETNDPR